MNQISSMVKLYLNRTHPFIRFMLVGVLNTCISLSFIFIFMNLLSLGYWLSTFLGNGLGAVNSFFFNRRFTFKSKVRYWEGGILFCFVIILCYGISYTLGEEFANRIILSPPYSNVNFREEAAVLAGSFFYTVFNYLGQKYIVFNNKRRFIIRKQRSH